MEDQQLKRIKQLIIRIGDQGKQFYERDIKRIIQVFTEYHNMNKKSLIQFIVNYLSEAIACMPCKTHIYAIVTALLSIKFFSLAQSIIQKVFSNLQINLNNSDLYFPKNAIVFLGQAMNIGLLNSYSFLGILFDLGHEAQKTIQSNNCYYLEILIKSLPYCMQSLTQKITDQFTNFLQILQKIIKRVNQKSELFVYQQTIIEYLNDKDVKYLGESKEMAKIFEYDLQKLKQIQKSCKITFNKKNHSIEYSTPIIYKGLVDKKYLIENIHFLVHYQNFKSLITSFNSNRTLLLQKITHYGSYYTIDSYLITKFIFYQALEMPTNYPIALYSSLLVSLSNSAQLNEKIQYRKAFYQISSKIYGQMQTNEIELVNPFCDILTFYFNNINAQWNWQEWLSLAQSSQIKSVILKLIFNKFAHLCSISKIQQNLSIQLLKYVPKSIKQYATQFAQDEQLSQQLGQINKLLKQKIQSYPLLEYLQKQNKQQLFFQIFLQSLLIKMSNSITHLNILLTRYQKLFIELKDKNNQYEKIILKGIFNFWSRSMFHLILYCGSFIQSNVVSYEVFKQMIENKVKMLQQSELQEVYRWYRVYSDVSLKLKKPYLNIFKSFKFTSVYLKQQK